MSIITTENLFLLSMMLIGATFMYVPLLLAMHILMPKIVVEKFWQQPYFRPLEIMMCSQGAYSPLRTQKLIATMVFPSIAKKRGLVEGMSVPRWYLFAARALIIWGLTACIGFISILAGLYIYAVTIGRLPLPDPTEFSLTGKIMLALFIFCIAFFIGKRWRRH